MAQELLARVVRSGFVEGGHFGSAFSRHADGSAWISAGDPDAPIFPRSANKPVQTLAMLRAGLPLTGELLALATASHAGEPFHLDGVSAILDLAHLDASALAVPIEHNCSGKHAAMLLTCVGNGWPVQSYLDPGHPLQQRIAQTLTEIAGEQPAAVGVDGCGAPLFAISLRALTRVFARFATARAGAEHAVAQAMRDYPQWLSGSARPVKVLTTAVPGLIAKDGAEGVFAAALPDGRAAAVKISDGAERAAAVLIQALLVDLGVDPGVLGPPADAVLFGGSEVVGAVEPVALGALRVRD